MSCIENGLAITNIIVVFVIGKGQIRISKEVEEFIIKQDKRDEQRRTEQIYADATKFRVNNQKKGLFRASTNRF